jgi:hypothetical protein
MKITGTVKTIETGAIGRTETDCDSYDQGVTRRVI